MPTQLLSVAAEIIHADMYTNAHFGAKRKTKHTAESDDLERSSPSQLLQQLGVVWGEKLHNKPQDRVFRSCVGQMHHIHRTFAL